MVLRIRAGCALIWALVYSLGHSTAFRMPHTSQGDARAEEPGRAAANAPQWVTLTVRNAMGLAEPLRVTRTRAPPQPHASKNGEEDTPGGAVWTSEAIEDMDEVTVVLQHGEALVVRASVDAFTEPQSYPHAGFEGGELDDPDPLEADQGTMERVELTHVYTQASVHDTVLVVTVKDAPPEPLQLYLKFMSHQVVDTVRKSVREAMASLFHNATAYAKGVKQLEYASSQSHADALAVLALLEFTSLHARDAPQQHHQHPHLSNKAKAHALRKLSAAAAGSSRLAQLALAYLHHTGGGGMLRRDCMTAANFYMDVIDSLAGFNLQARPDLVAAQHFFTDADALLQQHQQQHMHAPQGGKQSQYVDDLTYGQSSRLSERWRMKTDMNPLTEAEVDFHRVEADRLAQELGMEEFGGEAAPEPDVGVVDAALARGDAATDEDWGAAQSAWALGQGHEFGYYGLEVDYAKARYYYAVAARLGVPECVEALGMMDFNGLGTEDSQPNYARAHRYLARANTPSALAAIGDLHRSGLVPEEEEGGREVEKDAVRQRRSGAPAAVGVDVAGEATMVLDEKAATAAGGLGSDPATTAATGVSAGNIGRAWEYYGRADELGYAPATVVMGIDALYSSLPEDAQHPPAIEQEAAKHEHTSKEQRNYHLARLYFLRALNQSHTNPTLSYQITAATNEDSHKLMYDPDKLDAYYNLGLIHYNGWGVEPSCENSLDYLAMAARLYSWLAVKTPTSFYSLLQEALLAFNDERHGEARGRYEFLSWLGEPQSQLNAAFLWKQRATNLETEHGQTADATRHAFVLARRYYGLAAEQHVGEAERELGHCETGTGGWGSACGAAANYTAAAEWYERATQRKDLEGMKGLAYIYGRGLGGGDFALNATRSRELYARCSELGGYPDGMPCEVEKWVMEAAWAASSVVEWGARLVGWEW